MPPIGSRGGRHLERRQVPGDRVQLRRPRDRRKRPEAAQAPAAQVHEPGRRFRVRLLRLGNRVG